jgi:protein phosphatase
MTKLSIQAICDKGPTRGNNEDMISVGGILLRDNQCDIPLLELDPEGTFFLLLSDGMGGHEHGERASELLLQHLSDCFKQKIFTPETIEDQLREQVKFLSDKLNEEAIQEQQLRPMGCTLTGVVWCGNKAYLINAGDSRTYRYRNPYLRQLSTDQTERGMTGDPNASKLLLNCIGGGSFGRLIVEDITEMLDIDDIILICSDGLSDMVDNAVIEQILTDSEDPVHELFNKACENGGLDNTSIIVATLKK